MWYWDIDFLVYECIVVELLLLAAIEHLLRAICYHIYFLQPCEPVLLTTPYEEIEENEEKGT